jgi:hypothetical protein
MTKPPVRYVWFWKRPLRRFLDDLVDYFAPILVVVFIGCAVWWIGYLLLALGSLLNWLVTR